MPIRPHAAGLALCFAALTAVRSFAQFTPSSPTTDWVAVPYTNVSIGDPSVDHQTGQGEADIVGNTGTPATSLPSFFTKFIPGNTNTNGTISYRLRVGGDQNPLGFKSVALIGLDANRDGKLDLFLGVDNSGQSDGIYLWRPGTGLNISPSTTSMESRSPVKRYTVNTGVNYHWGSVTSASSTPAVALDPNANTAAKQDFNSATGTDYLLSFSIPFQDIVAALGAQGIAYNSSTVTSYVVGTATQANSFNQDLNGVVGSTNSTITWAALGVLTQPVDANGNSVNTAPVNTVGGARTATGSLALTGVSVSDAEGNLASVVLTSTNGTVSVSLAGGATVIAGANGSTNVTIGGTMAQINAALATLGFLPNNGYTGPASVTVASTDSGALSDSDSIAITVASGANTAPTANPDTATTHSGKAVTTYVIGNDTDANGNVLTITAASLTSGTGTLSFQDGNITYTPATNFVGTAVISYSISDGAGGTSSASLTVTVSANNPPVAVNDSLNANTNTVIFIRVLQNDSDADNDPLTITAASRTSGQGSVSIVGQELQFSTPNTNGVTVLSYTISDGSGGTSTASVTVTTGTNTAPVANADTATTNSGAAVDINVLANDTDANGDALNITDATVTSGSGTAVIVAGKVRFIPDSSFIGTAVISYTIDDGRGGTATASITVTVNGNTAPVAVANSYSVNEDTLLSVAASGVLANDTDANGNMLTAILVSTTSNGTLNLAMDGSFTYTPNANYSGPDSFTYKANDGGLDSNVVTVSLTVNALNDAPVAVANSYSVNEDATLSVTAPGVLANDSDVEGSALSAILVTGVSNGTLTLNANGSFTYSPNANYSGPDSFTYKANDGGLDSNVVTVSLTVNALNDAPVAVANSYSVDEDTTLTVNAPGVLGNDSDVEGSALSAILVTGVSNGTLTLNANGSFSYTPNANYFGPDSFTYKANDGGLDSNTVTVSITVNPINDGPVAVANSYALDEDNTLTLNAPGVLGNDSDPEGSALNAILVTGPSHGTLTLNANGSLSYTPTANYVGPDSFTYKANDGSLDSNVVTVTLAIESLNDAPVAVANSYTIDEDAILSIGAPGVLGNDSDQEGSALTAVLVTGVAHGTLNLNANGSFTYTPTANYFGPDSFTYKANDGTLDSNVVTVSITVNPINDAPVAVANTYPVNEDTTLTVNGPGVIGNDSDAEGSGLTAVLVTGTANGTLNLNANGSFTYTPSANYSGSDSFTYKVNDGSLDSNVVTVTLSVEAVNDAPVAVANSYSVDEGTTLTVNAPGLLGDDMDVEGSALTAVLVTGPANGTLTLNANGSFSYTPNANYSGPDSFTYKANDGTLDSNVVTVSLTVREVNSAPVAVANGYSVDEDGVLNISAPGLLGNDSDPENDSLTAVLVSGVAHGTLTLNPNGGFTYTPAANYAGPDSFTYKANDGTTDSNIVTVALTVNAINDAPVAGANSYPVDVNTALTINAPGLLGNDSDAEGSALTALLVGGPGHGTLTLNANGSFSYNPDANYQGPDSFTYKVNDGSLDSNVATVSFNVRPLSGNRVPTINAPGTITTSTGIAVPFTVTMADPDLDPLTLTISTPANGTVTGSGTSYTYTPAPGFVGSDSFMVTASDGRGGTASKLVRVTVFAPAGLVGNYALHLRDPEGNIHAHLLLTTTRMGRATGVVSVGGGRYTVRGYFGGSANILAPRSRGLGSVQLRLETGQSPLGVPELVVEVNDGTTTYTGRSPRSPYSVTNPAPQAGKYTIIASRDPRVIARTGAQLAEPSQAIPTVAASLTARVRPNGVVIINGYTGHGYRLTCSSYVMAGSQVPWFSGRMAPGASVQHSTLTFPADPVIPNDTAPAVSGLLTWHAEADSRIPVPFSGEYAVLGGRYTPPSSGPTLLNSNLLSIQLDVPSYVAEGTANPQIEVRPFTGNLLHHVEGNISTVRITFASGAYIGRIMGRVTRPFFGVIIQGETIDGGMGSLVDFETLGTSELIPTQR